MEELNFDLYSRNLLVSGFTPQMQQRLLGSSVFVVGAGGLGGVVLSYLCRVGVGRVAICEMDRVGQSNLQRQILYGKDDLGQSKAVCAARELRRVRDDIQIEVFDCCFTTEKAHLVRGYDLIIDCSDNYEARYAIDEVSERESIPFIYGTAQELSGQVALFENGGYRKLFPSFNTSKETVGVLSPMPAIVGAIQAMEAVKYLSGFDQTLSQKLLTINASDYKISIFKI